MLFVGLTGGIASGKSQVSKLFAQCGARIIDADELAHRAIEPDNPAWTRVVETFGEDVIDPDGRIDRAKLGRIVFDDAEKREWLNGIVHPIVFAEAERMRQEIGRREPDALVLFDAALLIETGAHELMDKVILVAADRRTQLKRLVERDGLSRAEAEQRIAAQLPLAAKKRHADYVIDGTQSLEALTEQVRKIHDEIKNLKTLD